MALWMPYAEDQALDLSKPVKKAPVSLIPESTYHEYACPLYNSVSTSYQYPSEWSQTVPLSPVTSEGSVVQQAWSCPLSPPTSPEIQVAEVDSLETDPRYIAFEAASLRALAEQRGGRLLECNPRMRRAVGGASAAVDDAYRQRRARNNAAAKQSRDRRKLREMRLSLQAAFLRQELAALRKQLAATPPCPHRGMTSQ